MNSSKEILENVRGNLSQLRFCGRLSFGGVEVDLAKSCDVMGFVLKQWLEGWLKKRGVEYAVNPNSQMPPDFFLDVKDDTHNLLEIKAFNSDASPGFDIADFTMYSEEIALVEGRAASTPSRPAPASSAAPSTPIAATPASSSSSSDEYLD